MSIPEESTFKSYTIGKLEQGAACCIPEPQLEIKNLSVSYFQKKALQEVSVDIYKGCITALIGPSGCGKTSFLSTLNRLTDLISGSKVEGQILFNREDIYEKNYNVQALRKTIGMIFQKPNPFPLSIRRNLEMPLQEHGLQNRTEIQDRVVQALSDVGLWNEVSHRLNNSALSLSGGQQQRLCIARALILEPKVLLMDEPCSALDPIASGVVEDLIQNLRNRFTVVIVTHNLAQAQRIANYAAFFWMQNHVGTLIEFDRCRSIFNSPKNPLTAAYVAGIQG